MRKRKASRPRPVRRRSRRSRKSLLLVFALVFGAAAAPRARAACVEFSFTSAISQAADAARAFAVADIDGDGELDVLSASLLDSKIAWYRNLGGGASWSEHPISTSAFFSDSVAAGDLDGDGDLDVISSSITDKVLWNENVVSDGTVWSEHTISTALNGPISVFVDDVDGDGDLDVLVASYADSSITWMDNFAGNGTVWTRHQLSAAASWAFSVFAADVDGDGDDDALSASQLDDTIAWYENPLPGTGTVWTLTEISTTADVAFGVSAADLDADGDVDVLAASKADDTVAWYENRPPRDGTVWSPHAIATDFDDARSAVAVDVDGDGDLDVLGAAFYESYVTWWESDGTPADGPWTVHTITATAVAGAYAAITGDVDGDGDPDVVAGSSSTDLVAWLRNDRQHGTALFRPPAVVSATPDGPTDLVAGDFDGDGDVDLATSSYYDDAIHWLENLGGSWTTHTVATSTTGGNQAVAASDLDRDGDLDLVGALREGSGQITWYENLGGQPVAWTSYTISSAESTAMSVSATDLDRDGDDDVLFVALGGPTLGWFENDGSPADGGWTRHAVTTAASNPRDAASGDLDGDGDLDLLFTRSGVDSLLWMESDGTPRDDAGWTTHLVVSGVEIDNPQAVALADLDRDGDLDAIVTAADAGVVVAYLNDGNPRDDGWVTASVGTAGGAVSLDVADVDGDGDPDLLVAAMTDDESLWFENDGTATAWTAHVLSTFPIQQRAVVAADLDGDGHLDAAAVGFDSDVVEWYRNPGTHVHDDGFDSDGATTACWSVSNPPVP